MDEALDWNIQVVADTLDALDEVVLDHERPRREDVHRKAIEERQAGADRGDVVERPDPDLRAAAASGRPQEADRARRHLGQPQCDAEAEGSPQQGPPADALDRILTKDDTASALAALPEDQRAAVLKKTLVEGMPPRAVELSWGMPERKKIDRPTSAEEWWWPGGKRLASFQDDRLVKGER